MPEFRGWTITRSTAKGKKYTASKGDKIVHFGAQGYTISPGTPKGDNYCSRSNGIKSETHSPNWFARALWSCRGAKSADKRPFFGEIELP
jgi:hypothetical protein